MESILRLGINCQHSHWGNFMSQDRCLASLEESGDGAAWVWAPNRLVAGPQRGMGRGHPSLELRCDPFNYIHLASRKDILACNLLWRKQMRNCTSANMCGVYKSLQITQTAFLSLSLSLSLFLSPCFSLSLFFLGIRTSEMLQKPQTPLDGFPLGPLFYFTC